MNKQQFVDLLRQPESISKSNFDELEELVSDNPYFHSAHTVIAKAAKLTKNQQAAKRINTAAIYATSRKALKNYIQGTTSFLEVEAPRKASISEQKPSQSQKEASEVRPSTPKEEKPVVQTSPKTDHDALVDEVYDNLEEWKKSRNLFLEYDLTDDSSDSEPEKKVKTEAESKAEKESVDKIKSQIAEEVIAEDEEVIQAIQDINKDHKPKVQEEEVDIEIEIEEESHSDQTEEKVDVKREEIEVENDDEGDIVNEEVEKIGEDVSDQREDTDSNEELLNISKQKESLKLSPGLKGGKKFRLNILNRPTSKSKPAEKKRTTNTSTAKKKTTGSATPKKTTAKKADAIGTSAKKTTASKKTTSSTSTKKAPAKKKVATKPKASTVKKTTASKAKPAKKEEDIGNLVQKALKATEKTVQEKNTKSSDSKKKNELKKKENDELISAFIEENPSIDPSSTRVSDQDLSKKSVEFPKKLVTENFAKILEKQGKNEKAIQVYKKLIASKHKKKKEFEQKIKQLESDTSRPGNDKLLADFQNDHPDLIVLNWKDLKELVTEITSDAKSTPKKFININTVAILEASNLKKRADKIRDMIN